MSPRVLSHRSRLALQAVIILTGMFFIYDRTLRVLNQGMPYLEVVANISEVAFAMVLFFTAWWLEFELERP